MNTTIAVTKASIQSRIVHADMPVMVAWAGKDGMMRERSGVMQMTMEWQPIETAPKDGTPLLLYGGVAYNNAKKAQYVGFWGRWDSAGGEFETWICSGPHWRPTHWMLLPTPPSTEQSPAP